MTSTIKQRGPWLHRFLAVLLTVLLTLLAFWLLGFVMEDIGSLPGPKLEEVEKRLVSKTLLQASQEVERRLGETSRAIADQQHRQALLRDSTSGFQRTMNQLLEMQRLNLEKGVALAGPQQKALAESAELFLANQKRDQKLTEEIAGWSEQQRGFLETKRGLDEKLAAERKTARTEWERLDHRHDLKVAGLKLLFLLPLLITAVVLFLRMRGGLYAPLVYASGAALLWQTILVIHQHFPTRYFKYIVLCAAIAIVIYLLVVLLRMLRFPKATVLLKQYREAYERFFCPVCEYPVRRGPLRYLYWTRRSLRKLTVAGTVVPGSEAAYTCPSCGSRLYEPCPTCKSLRHSLLPFCESCGAGKEVSTGVSA